jgi:proteasome accessory factor B
MRRIERLVNLIAALLEARRPMTAAEIRAQIAGYDQDSYETFRRTFERDKDALREMGVPVELKKIDALDSSDGYIIPKERYYLPDLDLEPDELAALRLASQTLLGRGEEEAEAGLLKLSLGEDPGAWVQPQAIAGTNMAVEEPHLGPLYSALSERRPVRFRYVDGRGRRSRRRVEPYGLVHRAGHWYLIGRDVDADDQRTFKLSRMESRLERLEGAYEIAAGFDASRTVRSEGWEFGSADVAVAVVRFAARARWWAEQNLSRLPLRDVEGGALDVEMSVGNRDALLGWVIGWHGLVTIEHPQDLRAQLVEHLRPWLGGDEA